MPKRKERIKDLRRLTIVVIAVFVFWIILIIRLIHIQLINKGKYVDMGIQQYVQEEKLETSRGIIYDRNLTCMAINQPIFSLGIDLRQVLNPKQVARKLSTLLKINENKLLKDLTSNRNFIWIVREIDEKLADAVLAEKIQGVNLVKESKRVYPQKHVAAQLIGFTDVDERGLSGIEYALDAELQGKSGRALVQQDAFGTKLTSVNYGIEQPEAGKDVVLTIDCTYQSIVEEELRRSVQSFGADGGIVVVLNPKTGEILALACEPGFDNNHARNIAPSLWRNRAITDIFEPGSTFKIVLMSAIIQEKIKHTKDNIFCENGRYEILNQIVKDHKGYGELPLGDVLVYSSNIGMAKLSKALEAGLFYQYARDFGFGNLTNIDLGGEIAGELKHPVDWSDFTSIAMAMGYEVAVTPLQLSMAYAAIANGGKLIKPQIVREIGENIKTPKEIKPIVIRQILTPATAKTLRDLLEQAVERGTGTKAKIDGLPICGKTGTAHKYALDTKGYSPNEFLASFVGFYPAQNPEILICTMLDNPRTTYWGGEVAAPTFKRIVQRLINLENRLLMQQQPPVAENSELNSPTRRVFSQLPDFSNRRWDWSQQLLAEIGIKALKLNDGQVIATQEPPPGTPISEDMTVNFSLFNINRQDSGYCITPGVVGLSLREAVNRLTLVNLQPDIHGNGRVIRQTPAAGEKIKIGARCRLECRAGIKPELFPAW